MIASHEKRAAIYLDDCFDTTAHSPTLAKESLGMNKGTLEARGIRRTVVCLGTFEKLLLCCLPLPADSSLLRAGFRQSPPDYFQLRDGPLKHRGHTQVR